MFSFVVVVRYRHRKTKRAESIFELIKEDKIPNNASAVQSNRAFVSAARHKNS